MAFYRQLTRNRIQSSLKEHKTSDRGLQSSISNFLTLPRLAMFYSDFEINENYCSIGCSRNLRSEGTDNFTSHRSGRGHEITKKLPMPSLRVCWNSTNGTMELSSEESSDYISTESSDLSKKTDELFIEKPEKTTQEVKYNVRYNDLDDEEFKTRFSFDSHPINYLKHAEINSISTGLSNASERSHHRNSLKHSKEKSSSPSLSDPSGKE